MDADLELANLPTWEVTLGGRVHRARPLSWPAFRRFELGVQQARALLAEGKADGLALLDAATEQALRQAFPVRWWYVLRPGRDPVTLIRRLPPRVREKVLADFFGYLGRIDETPPPAEAGTAA